MENSIGDLSFQKGWYVGFVMFSKISEYIICNTCEKSFHGLSSLDGWTLRITHVLFNLSNLVECKMLWRTRLVIYFLDKVNMSESWCFRNTYKILFLIHLGTRFVDCLPLMIDSLNFSCSFQFKQSCGMKYVMDNSVGDLFSLRGWYVWFLMFSQNL